ncbi:hypothetical protein OS493_033683 [Desmophyllum pertusum]|uniref:Uncharacterized protein n=1 Tax=Desmophyllum pertusum TaxID=174260 RepID=A0A9W9ZJ28_9CNID|nr:hypothetical protein OS493_033683 [Desmophyllum pertusum]
MADITTSTRATVVDVREQIQSMSTNIRSFSTSMRSLYEENSVEWYTEAGVKFRKIRDETRNDSMVYLKSVLPLSTQFVASVSEFFGYYEAFEYNKWCEMLPYILEKTVGYRQHTETLLQMHEDMLVHLKKRQGEARIVVTELRDLKDKYERRRREYEDTASTKRGWAIGLAFVPFVNLIASPALAASSQSDMQEAAVNRSLAASQETAAVTVSSTLIPALQAFINGIKMAAGFFSVMEQELRKFEGKGEKGKRLHYKVMKLEARDMKSTCQTFKAVLPHVRNDLSAMKEKCNASELAINLLAAILGGEGTSRR